MKRNKAICLMHPRRVWVKLLDKSQVAEWRFHYWPKGRGELQGFQPPCTS